MRHSKEILIFLLFVGLSTLLWWGNAADKQWQHSSPIEMLDQEVNLLPGEQLTEKKLTVPIEVLDVPQNKTVRVFPSKAVVFLRVRVEDYPAVEGNDLRVWCTYPTRSQETLTLHVDIQDERIRSVRTEPEEVEYIIEN